MSPMLKVCFMIDCTLSMDKRMPDVRRKVKELIEQLEERYKDFTIYASLIGYRDFKEKMYRIDFTDDIFRVRDGIEQIIPSGGNDAAEDVSGAYRWATCLKWDADVNLLYHLTDAPDHGMMYHDYKVSDNYPEGNPIIDLREEVRNLALNCVDVTVFRLNKSTEIMYDIMRINYLKVRDHGFTILNFNSSKFSSDDDITN